MPFLVDFIDVSPAFGVWNFKFDLLYLDSLNRFEAKNAVSYGLGVGTEWVTQSIICRLWYGQDFAFSFDKSQNAVNIKTFRGGVDFMGRFLDFRMSSKTFTFSGLAFLGGDSIFLERSNVVVESEDTIVNTVNYVQAYAGGGLSVSW
jgi:hypothetical protein